MDHAEKVVDLFGANHDLMHELVEDMELFFSEKDVKRYPLLEALERSGRARLKDIAKRFGASSSSMCVALARMEKEGLVIREIDEKDRRNTYYSLSPSGRAVKDGIHENIRKYTLRIFEPLNEEELKGIGEAFAAVNKILEGYLKRRREEKWQ
ncbi:MAG: MarR family transcriptional regulator [Helicobacteraceae bacterium]|nr:MarR family transcriptional regulator [Helicobacteraceae bacterium]